METKPWSEIPWQLQYSFLPFTTRQYENNLFQNVKQRIVVLQNMEIEYFKTEKRAGDKPLQFRNLTEILLILFC